MHNFKMDSKTERELEEGVMDTSVMPSMRCLMTAGEALRRENIAGYNCSYVAVDRVAAFDEILYVLMNGTGVGFSVERQYVSQLPTIAEEFHPSDTVIVVADSKLGWAKAFKELIGMLYVGLIPRWDTSKVREAGAPLKTFGGRASGPEPLEALFNFSVNIFTGASGRKLSSVECHDVVCKIAEVVVVGGVRRSALISLSNLSDDRMRAAKSGQWWTTEPQRALAKI
jgi:ribonucleoside-diphosphate reductase alpha chain